MSKKLSTCISAISKKNTPINDSQDKKVYNMDALISELAKKSKPNFNTKDDFFKVALTLFQQEGVNGYKVENNKSKRVSNINNYRKILTFSANVIAEKDYEVVLHELAHALCRYRGGYNYTDAHGELFVYFLFDLITKYFNIDENELNSFADKEGINYFYNTVLLNKSISEKEYNEILNKNTFLEKFSSPIEKNEFLNHLGYDLNNKTFISLFKNDNTFWIFERKMFKFEEVINIDPFKNKTDKELSNIFIISPIYNADVSGYKIKSGKFSVFNFSSLEAAKENKHYTLRSEKKRDTIKMRTNKIKEMKSRGYKVLAYSDFNQFYATQNFYIESLKK